MQAYLNHLTGYLIDAQDFQPVSTELWGDTAEGEVLLVRHHWGNWQFVRLLNVDNLDERAVQHLLCRDEEKFKELQYQTKSNGVVGITLLIASQEVPGELREKFLALQQKNSWQNTYALVWLMELSTERVWKHAGRPWRVFISPQLLTEVLAQSSKGTGYVAPSQANQHPIMGQGTAETADQQKAGVTMTFLGINILVFGLMTLWGGTEDTNTLILFGAKYSPAIKAGEYWRLITSMFIHIGALHLVFNSFALYQLGRGVEYLYGSLKYAIIYILAGLTGSVASFVFSPHLSAGASGAIFGLFGALLYFGRREPHIFSKGLGGGILATLVVNLAFGFMNPGIDNYAHLGGLLGGYLVSNALGLREDSVRAARKLGQLLLIFLALGVFFYYGLLRLSNTGHF